MAKYRKIVFVTTSNKSTNLNLLADSLNLITEYCKRSDLFNLTNDGETIVAYPMSGRQLHHRHTANDIHVIAQSYPIFLYDCERSNVDPVQALDVGVRGVIFHDEQLDRVLTALRVISNGQLYYPRWLLSDLVDEMLERRLEKASESLNALQQTALTKQELNIVKLVVDGARNKEVANELNISTHTVKSHLSSIFRKTQARNRVELLRWSQQSNIINYALSFES